jgi:hypothetical protein
MSTEHDKKSEEFIPVNQVLNTKPQLGPIPGEQVIPWLAIVIISYLICQGVLGFSWIATCLVSAWGIGSWWTLTGNESWRFLSKFQRVPTWTRGHLPYTSLLNTSAKGIIAPKRKRPASSRRRQRR